MTHTTAIAILILLAQAPPMRIIPADPTPPADRRSTYEPPIYIRPLPNDGAYTPQFQIVQPGSKEPPAYVVPQSDGSVEIIQPAGRR
jgi:hypothetical protein